jgi:hypothetical protein
MAAVMVRAWTGLLRANMASAVGRLSSITAYNAKHPTLGLLSPTDLVEVEAAIAVLNAKLIALKPR